MRTLLIALVAVALLAGCNAPPATTNEPTGSPPASPPTATPPAATPPPASSNDPCAHADTGAFATPNADFVGSGATFPKPLLEAWALCFNAAHSNIRISYAGGGSGKGISDITAKNTIFGASDAPLQPNEKANAQKNGEVILQFPETLGAVAIVYNIEGVASGLKLDGETLGKIYNGQITFWDDAAITGQNNGVTLPHASIATVARSDSSGTTFAFTDFLMKASPNWASNHPAAQKAQIAQLTLYGAGNEGVGSTVKTTANSIGYVELAFMTKLSLTGAAIKNKDGNHVMPSSEGASLDAAGITLPAPEGDWSTVSIAYAGGGQSYPVSTFTYMLVYSKLADYGSKATADQLTAFKAWMWWSTHDGQKLSANYGYSPMPEVAVKAAENALKAIQ